MPVTNDCVTGTKGRPLPIDPAGLVISTEATNNLLAEILNELYRIRVLLATAFDIGDDFSDLTSDMEDGS